MSEWIPVKWREPTEEEREEHPGVDRMADFQTPNEYEQILITTEYTYRGETKRCVSEDTFMVDSCDGDIYLDRNQDWDGVVAWRPMPEPYMGGKGKE